MLYARYWAKSDRANAGSGAWVPYPEHVAAVALCALVLCERRPLLLRRVASLLRCSIPDARAFVVLAASLHDVGKLCFLFQAMNERGYTRTYGKWDASATHLRTVKGGKVIAGGWHHGNDGFDLVQVLTRRNLLPSHDPVLVRAFAAGSWHHGSTSPLNRSKRKDEVAEWWVSIASHTSGGQEDVRAISDFLRDVASVCPIPVLPRLPHADYTEALQVVAGIVAVADWLGSNEDIFAFKETWEPRSYGAALGDPAMRLRAEEAVQVESLGEFPPAVGSFMPSNPSPLQVGIGSFLGRLVIIESPTGEGKTEAGFILFHALLLSRLVDHGVMGLPTQATTNMMYDRLRVDFRRVFGKDGLVLIHHGEARGRIRYLTEQSSGEASSLVDSSNFGWEWLRSGKRVMLAPMSVVTIDQILMVALAGHLHKFVRQMALSTAFLVIDEVHDLDSYMNGVLVYALEVLARSGTHVALLSATLTDSSRKVLVDAFARGLDLPPPTVPSDPDATRVLSLYEGGRVEVKGFDTRRAGKVTRVRHRTHRWLVQDGYSRAHPDDVEAAARDLADKVRAGACVGWIRTTVWDVQETISILKRVAPDVKVIYLHASLCSDERTKVEGLLGEVLGKSGKGRCPVLVVGTSILGISLDIDFDYLLLDLMALDALLQGGGRCHRHDRSRPLGFEDKVFDVFVPDDLGAYSIYDLIYEGQRYPLYRTWEWVQTNPTLVDPDDCRKLLAEVLDAVPPIVGAPGYDRWVADRESNERHETWAKQNMPVRDDLRIVPLDTKRKAPTRLGTPYSCIVPIVVEGTTVRCPHLPHLSGVDVGVLLGLDTQSHAAMRKSVRKVDWQVWKALTQLVKTAGAHRATFAVGEVSKVYGHPLGQALTGVWTAAPAYPRGVAFVPVDGSGMGSLERTRHSESGPVSSDFEVSYRAEYGLTAKKL